MICTYFCLKKFVHPEVVGRILLSESYCFGFVFLVCVLWNVEFATILDGLPQLHGWYQLTWSREWISSQKGVGLFFHGVRWSESSVSCDSWRVWCYCCVVIFILLVGIKFSFDFLFTEEKKILELLFVAGFVSESPNSRFVVLFHAVEQKFTIKSSLSTICWIKWMKWSLVEAWHLRLRKSAMRCRCVLLYLCFLPSSSLFPLSLGLFTCLSVHRYKELNILFFDVNQAGS